MLRVEASRAPELRPAERTAAEPVAKPPAEPPPAVATLSYSALTRHAACGYRFYLERVLRLPEQQPPGPTGPPTAGLDAMVRGSIAHELLERIDLAAPVIPDDDAIRAAASTHEVELTDADVTDLGALLAGAAHGPLAERVAAARERHPELGFALALGGPHEGVPLLTGFIDLVAWEADGGALVVDYKTDRLDGADPEVAVETAYGAQRRIYALAALRAGAARVEVAHLFLERPAEPAVASYEAADIERLEAEIAALAEGVVDGHFEVTPHPYRELCATCPGRGGLCSWPEERVLLPLAAA